MALDDQTPPAADASPIQPAPPVADANADLNMPLDEADKVVAETSADEPPAEPLKPAEDESVQRRINELTREKYEARREADAHRQRLEAAMAEAEALRKKYEPDARPDPEAEIERRAEERAEQKIAQREWDRQCNDIFEKGTKDYSDDFAKTIEAYKTVGGLQPGLIKAAIATGEPAKVLYDLAKDPDEARRVMALDPEARGVAVAKIAARPAPVPAVSKAPPPIKGISTSGGKVETDPSKMPMEEWEKRFPLPGRA